MKKMMSIVTRNLNGKTMMTSYNQCLATEIINTERFEDLKIDLHDWKLYSKAYSELSQASEMKLFEKVVNRWKSFTIFSKSSILCVWLGSAYASGIAVLFKCRNFH